MSKDSLIFRILEAGFDNNRDMLKLEQLYSLIDQEASRLKWPEEPKLLYDPLRYMMDMGGKRLRPRLCLTSYNLFKDDIGEHILSPALALEVFHNFTLIHDDIMDNADIRRGVPTVYRKWNDNIAILSGDTMCLWAFKMIGKAPKQTLDKALNLFTKTTIEVCEGQQMDMDFETRNDVSLDEYIKMIGLKTSVLLACSSAMGAVIAGAPDKICEGLYNFGYKLGIAFQIQDDWLDSFGDEKTFGKKIGGDILNNKQTWLLIKCREMAQEKDRQNGSQTSSRLKELLAMAETSGEEKIKAVKEFYCSLEIDRLAEEAVNAYYTEAMQSLKNSGLKEDQIRQMETIATSLVKRNR